MDLFFLSSSLATNLTEAAKLIQMDPDLEQQDVPVVEELIRRLDSALAVRSEGTESREPVSSKLADRTKERRKTGKNLLTEKEAAGYLKVHPISLKRWRLAGKGPKYVALGPRQIRYEDVDLDVFADQLKEGGQDGKAA